MKIPFYGVEQLWCGAVGFRGQPQSSINPISTAGIHTLQHLVCSIVEARVRLCDEEPLL
jgi:hypothetical protein